MPQHAAAIGWAIGGTQPVRASPAFLLSAAALLPVAACAELTDVSHLTVAEQTEIC
jgi:hypothetical protein